MQSSKIAPVKSKCLRYLKSYCCFLRNKKVGFYSNFGHGDLGDDASFFVAKDLFKSDIVPISKRCNAFNPRMLKGLCIGGAAPLRWQSPYIPRGLIKKSKWDFPVVLLSGGINCDYGEDYSKDSLDKIKALCNLCDYISVKDKLTQKFLNDLGFSNVSILPDLEIALEEEPFDISLKKDKPIVGIIVSPHSEFSDDTFSNITQVFVKFTDYLISKGNSVIFLPFDIASAANTKEKEIITSIVEQVKNKDEVSTLENIDNPAKLLFVIGKYCQSLVTMRLHSAIFAANAQVPFISIRYNLMHDGFLDMMDSKDLSLSLFEGFSSQALQNKFEYLSNNHASIKDRMLKKKKYLKDMILKEAATIKNILKL
jgi:hypothetical protein